MDDFSASNGQLEKFCGRENIGPKISSGESANNDQSSRRQTGIKSSLLIKECTVVDAFIIDETDLFYKMHRGKSLGIKGSKLYGLKKSKLRIITMLCYSLKAIKNAFNH